MLTLAVVPQLASYWLLDEVLQSAIGLIVKPKSQQLLLHYQHDLKTLKRLDPENEEAYKVRFLQANDELMVYEQAELVQQVLRDSFLTYYLILFIGVLLLSVLTAFWLIRQVALSYKSLVIRDVQKAEKLRDLTYFDQWQTIAGKLAHEINNPLTPIEVMVSNLSRTYRTANCDEFAKNLIDTNALVREEVKKLKDMVSHFSRFSKLPEPQLQRCNFVDYCVGFIEQYQQTWPNVVLQFSRSDDVDETLVDIDYLLFNQCLINLVNNAVQANQEKTKLAVTLSVSPKCSGEVTLVVQNDGCSIKAEDSEAIFQMYYSSKSVETNMGLGLAIVRKIIFDHGGNIYCLPTSDGAAFEITLPIMSAN